MATAIGPETTNGAAHDIEYSEPYVARVTVVGVADLLFHRWNCEAVAEKSKAAKGSKAKKTDNVESYVYRDADGLIGIPGEYLRQSIIHAAKYRQDPRSPRKSAMDMFKAGVVSLDQLVLLGGAKKTWDYEHRCRVTVQRAGITRCRPAFLAGWSAEFTFLITLPEYISPAVFNDVAVNAGRLVGRGDFRPCYGRFRVTGFSVGLEA